MTYPRNSATPPTFTVGQVVKILDGEIQTSGVSAMVKIGSGSFAASSGTLAYNSTTKFWNYTPAQAETVADFFIVEIYKTDCLGAAQTIITSASNVSGYAGTDQSKITNPTATVALSNTTISTSQAVASVSGNVGGSVASVTNAVTVGTINNNTITAASIAASALDSKGNWNIGKTGYALTAGTGLGNQTANITGNLSGSVNSVTTRVTANTDQWNGVAVTGMPMPTFTLPANFSSLFITSGGYVIVSGDAFGNTFLIPNLASQSSVDTLTTYVDTEVLAIKAKTDNLPASPAAVSDIPTVGQVADGVWDEVLTGATHNIASSAGRRLRQLASVIVRAGTAQGPGTGNNQIQLDAGASSTNGDYDPGLIFIETGTGAGQARLILQYNGSTKVATVDRDWRVNPDSTSEFVILADAGRQSVNEGLAQAGSSTTITLNTSASSNDDAYNGQLIFIRSGTGQDQVALVEDYVGSTKVATIRTRSATGQWAVVPDTTSAYVMIPNLTFTLDEIANSVAATQALSRLDSMIESDGAGQFRFDTIALEQAPAGGGGGTVNIVVEDRSITVE